MLKFVHMNSKLALLALCLLFQDVSWGKIKREDFYLDIGDNFPKEAQGGSGLVFKLNFLYHIQGINRFPNSHYLILSGNSKKSSYLYLGNMKSQPANGSWRSNLKCRRTWRGKKCSGNQEDRITQVFNFHSKFKHIGGVDTEGKLVAVALDTDDEKGEIHFFKLEDENLIQMHHLTIKTPHRNAAVSFKKLKDHNGKVYYMVIAFDIRFLEGKEATVYTFEGNLAKDTSRFTKKSNMKFKKGKLPYYQNVNLFQGKNGKVMLKAFYRKRLFKIFPFIGKDIVDTYEVRTTGLKKIGSQRIRTKSTNFLAGSGSYTSFNGEQAYLSTAYWPFRRTLDKSKVIRFEQFYNAPK